MTDPIPPQPRASPLFVLLVLVVVCAALKAAATLVVPLLAALFLALLCSPPIAWLHRRGVPSWAGITVVTTALFGGLLLLAVTLGNSMVQFSRSLPAYETRARDLVGATAEHLGSLGLHVQVSDLHHVVHSKAVVGFLGSLVSEFGVLLGNTVLVYFTVVFILFDALTLPKRVRVMTDSPEGLASYMDALRRGVEEYFGITTFVSMLTGLLVAGMLFAIGVDYAPLWGFLAFSLNFVPNIGSIIAAVPAVGFTLLQLGPEPALLAVGGYTVINLLIGNVVGPRLMARGLSLSTLTVFVSLIFWGWLLGPVGMVVSVPLTGAVKLALEAHEKTRRWAVLLGTVEDPPAPVVAA